jgi:tRNA1Val (adenine37-N6)-methyltransferase
VDGDDYFHFQKFSMLQAPSGQRINTDSCVFGGVIAERVLHPPQRILDIGSGTGVLALMLATRCPTSQIVAIEPEPTIAALAHENFHASPWRHQFKTIVARAQDLDPRTHGLFDLVICNPPYFQNSMTSSDHPRMLARHNVDLNPIQIYETFVKMASERALSWLSCPHRDLNRWVRHGVEVGLHQTHNIIVSDYPQAMPHMAVLGWSKFRADTLDQDTIYYRNSHKGPPSDWMNAFRQQWYPERYNTPLLRR